MSPLKPWYWALAQPDRRALVCVCQGMAAEYIELIQRLAGQFRPEERNLTLYFPDLETAPADDNLYRVFGPPVGLTADDWPRYARLGELLSDIRRMAL